MEGIGEFFLFIGKMYRFFGIYKKYIFLVFLFVDKYEVNLKFVVDYIKSLVDEVKEVSGKNITNGLDGIVFFKIVFFV